MASLFFVKKMTKSYINKKINHIKSILVKTGRTFKKLQWINDLSKLNF